MTFLYDFYGPLLTEKQQKFVDLYYGNDFSLGEIAENYGVSRQAVHDTLKRSEHLLDYYESKLGLTAKFIKERNQLSEVNSLLGEFECDQDNERLLRARLMLQELLDMDRG